MTKLLGVMTVVLAVLQAFSALASDQNLVPKNIIMVIVDGGGLAQIEAAEIYMGDRKLRFREFPFQGTVTTHNVDGGITDSAAAATAIATGRKVKNGVLSERFPGDGAPFKTMLERAKDLGKSTGLVTTTLFTDATPAAFGAHSTGRDNTQDILNDYFTDSLPNVVFGADESSYRLRVASASAPYLVATSRKSLLEKTSEAVALGTCEAKNCPRVYGGFGSYPMFPGYITSWSAIPLEAASREYFSDNDIPHLSDMASSALSILSQNQNGFFLMLESGLVDWIGHRNRSFLDDVPQASAAYALGVEYQELNRTLDILLEFLEAHPDTLIVLTADHETGGLVVEREATQCIGQMGCLAKLKWTSPLYDDSIEPIAKHTGANVGVYAIGKNSHVFASAKIVPMDNTEFVSKIFAESRP